MLMGDICSSLVRVKTYSLLSIGSVNKSVGNDENDYDNDDDDDDDEDDGGGNVYRGCDVSPAGLAPRDQPIIIQMLPPSLYHSPLLATSYIYQFDNSSYTNLRIFASILTSIIVFCLILL